MSGDSRTGEPPSDRAALPRRTPGRILDLNATAVLSRGAVGRARVPGPTLWADDAVTVQRLLDALRTSPLAES